MWLHEWRHLNAKAAGNSAGTSAIWAPDQEQALEQIRACGFLPVEDAIASLVDSM
jgi:hypothetical protein